MVVVVVDAKEAFNTCDCSFGIIINIIGSSLVLIAGGAYRWRDIGLGTSGGMDGRMEIERSSVSQPFESVLGHPWRHTPASLCAGGWVTCVAILVGGY